MFTESSNESITLYHSTNLLSFLSIVDIGATGVSVLKLVAHTQCSDLIVSFGSIFSKTISLISFFSVEIDSIQSVLSCQFDLSIEVTIQLNTIQST
jgi:hypothetical protein